MRQGFLIVIALATTSAHAGEVIVGTQSFYYNVPFCGT